MIYDLIGPEDKVSTPTDGVSATAENMLPGDLVIWGEFTSKASMYHISDHEHELGSMGTHKLAMAIAEAVQGAKP